MIDLGGSQPAPHIMLHRLHLEVGLTLLLIRQKTLPGTDCRVIPRQLFQSLMSTFFDSFIITPFLQSSGTHFSSRYSWVVSVLRLCWVFHVSAILLISHQVRQLYWFSMPWLFSPFLPPLRRPCLQTVFGYGQRRIYTCVKLILQMLNSNCVLGVQTLRSFALCTAASDSFAVSID